MDLVYCGLSTMLFKVDRVLKIVGCSYLWNLALQSIHLIFGLLLFYLEGLGGSGLGGEGAVLVSYKYGTCMGKWIFLCLFPTTKSFSFSKKKCRFLDVHLFILNFSQCFGYSSLKFSWFCNIEKVSFNLSANIQKGTYEEWKIEYRELDIKKCAKGAWYALQGAHVLV